MTTTAKTSARAIECPHPTREAPGRSSPQKPDHLTGFIDAELARTTEADPHIIAKRLLSKVPEALLDSLLFTGLAERVAARIRMNRAGGVRVSASQGASRWQIAQRVCVAGEHRLLADCDVSALLVLAEQHQEIAARNLTRGREYEELADQLRASGCATVGEMWAAAEKSLAA